MRSRYDLLFILLVPFCGTAFADNARQEDAYRQGIPVTRLQRQVLNVEEKAEFARLTVEEKARSEAKLPMTPSQEKILGQQLTEKKEVK